MVQDNFATGSADCMAQLPISADHAIGGQVGSSHHMTGQLGAEVALKPVGREQTTVGKGTR